MKDESRRTRDENPKSGRSSHPQKSSHPRSNWVVMIFKKPSRRSTKKAKAGVVSNMEAIKGNEPDKACPKRQKKRDD